MRLLAKSSMCRPLVTYILGRKATDASRPPAPVAPVDPVGTSPPPQLGLGSTVEQPTQQEIAAPTSPALEPPSPSPPTDRSPPPDAAPTSPPPPPSSPPQTRRGHIPASERFQRTLGAYPMRDRRPAAARLASAGSPSNRREAIAEDEKGWTGAESGEINNHECSLRHRGPTIRVPLSHMVDA